MVSVLMDDGNEYVLTRSFAETLFAPTSTPQRKYWGFEVVSKALPLLSDEMLPFIFTQNFMKCWMNHLSGEDRYLHKAAQRIVSQSLAIRLSGGRSNKSAIYRRPSKYRTSRRATLWSDLPCCLSCWARMVPETSTRSPELRRWRTLWAT